MNRLRLGVGSLNWRWEILRVSAENRRQPDGLDAIEIMKKTHHFSVSKTYPFPASRMWSIFSDFAESRNPSASIQLEEEGDPDNHQIGAIRSTKIGKDTFREQLTAYEPGKSLTYELLSGAPVEHYFGTIQINPINDSQSEVAWSVRCTPNFPIPGWIIEKNAKKVIRNILDELYRELSRT